MYKKKKGAFSSANAFSGSDFLMIEERKIARRTINNVFSHTNPTHKQNKRRKWRKIFLKNRPGGQTTPQQIDCRSTL